MMKYYQEVTGYNISTLTASITLDPDNSDFLFAGGIGHRQIDSTGIITGFVFSGYNGYIFDESGNFIHGYQPNSSFNITVHNHSGTRYSYFVNDVLIGNNFSGDCFDFIEFEKYGQSAIFLSHQGEENDLIKNTALLDSTGNILVSSDNIILRSYS